jgi:ribA/ribD-fused uncharacterized protein
MKIDDFRGEYRFLSNYHIVDVEYDGKVYPSTEHAYQAAKTLNEKEREKIRSLTTPKDAKKLGKIITMRTDWDSIKFEVMLELIRKKFDLKHHPELAKKLLDTKDAELIEGNWWNDTTWGVCNGIGKNWLGKILMQVRDELSKKNN